MARRIFALLLAAVLIAAFTSCSLFNPTIIAEPNETERISVTQRSFYCDSNDLYYSLSSLRHGLNENMFCEEELLLYTETLLRDMEGLGDYYTFHDRTSYKKGGNTYGAEQDTNPIGGGEGYSDIYTTGDYIVTDDDEFMDATKNAVSGEVIFIPSDAVIDLSDLRITENFAANLNRGVIIASDRGHNGSKGGTLYFSADHSALLRCFGNNRITGLCLQSAVSTMANGQPTKELAIGILATGKSIEIDNCEISGFTNTAISANSQINIHHNYIHNNSIINGYGISITGGSAVIESNLFSNNTVNIYARNFEELLIHNNIDAGTVREASVKIEGKQDSRVTITNNSFLGSAAAYVYEGIEEKDITIQQNAFDFTSGETQALLGIKGFGEAKQPKTITAVPDITTRVFAGDKNLVFEYILRVKENSDNTDLALEYATRALSELCGFSNYYEYLDNISIEKDGVVYGAYTEEGGSPIGGGVGMTSIYTTGDYVVNSLDSLISALDRAKSGEVVFIEGSAVIDTTSRSEKEEAFVLKEGVTLASDRGRVLDDGTVSAGARICSTKNAPVMIRAYADSRIEGLILAGADTQKHMNHHKRGVSEGRFDGYYYLLPLSVGVSVHGDNFQMVNCEVAGFGNSGVLLAEAENTHIRNSYFHHNQRMGLGYGVCLGSKATSVIEYNLFNFDRHSIAANGSPGTGYIARYNIQMGDAIYHVFDAHGGNDRGDGTNIACEYVDMYNNTILCDALPYKKRGVPEQFSKFYRNVVINPFEYYSTRYMEGVNMTFFDNIFGIRDIEAPEYNYEGGKQWSLSVSNFNKAVRSNGISSSVFYMSEEGYITSAGAGLRWAYIIAFSPDGDGTYRITEYGNNLDDGSIMDYDEKVYIPEDGFVLVFTGDNPDMKALYDYISEEYSVLYNTTAVVRGGYIADVEGTLGESITIRVTAAKKAG